MYGPIDIPMLHPAVLLTGRAPAALQGSLHLEGLLCFQRCSPFY